MLNEFASVRVALESYYRRTSDLLPIDESDFRAVWLAHTRKESIVFRRVLREFPAGHVHEKSRRRRGRNISKIYVAYIARIVNLPVETVSKFSNLLSLILVARCTLLLFSFSLEKYPRRSTTTDNTEHLAICDLEFVRHQLGHSIRSEKAKQPKKLKIADKQRKDRRGGTSENFFSRRINLRWSTWFSIKVAELFFVRRRLCNVDFSFSRSIVHKERKAEPRFVLLNDTVARTIKKWTRRGSNTTRDCSL